VCRRCNVLSLHLLKQRRRFCATASTPKSVSIFTGAAWSSHQNVRHGPASLAKRRHPSARRLCHRLNCHPKRNCGTGRGSSRPGHPLASSLDSLFCPRPPAVDAWQCSAGCEARAAYFLQALFGACGVPLPEGVRTWPRCHLVPAGGRGPGHRHSLTQASNTLA
jgi:hypothetical protein